MYDFKDEREKVVSLNRTPVLQVVDGSYRVGGRWILKHIHLTLYASEGLLLLGRNGSGKTSLMEIFATLRTFTQGSIAWWGEGACMQRVRPRLGFLSHRHYFYESLSGYENLCFIQKLRGQPFERAKEVLEQVRLAQAAERPVACYSAGMKQRLGLARQILLQPDLLLLDEPWSSVDHEGGDLVEMVLQAHRQRGGALILTSHQQQQRASSYCQHIQHLVDGSLCHSDEY
jgi:heme ABC exporter ATP-binding subunit CcmA